MLSTIPKDQQSQHYKWIILWLHYNFILLFHYLWWYTKIKKKFLCVRLCFKWCWHRLFVTEMHWLNNKGKSGSARSRTWGLPRPQTTRVCCPLHHWTRVRCNKKFHIYIECKSNWSSVMTTQRMTLFGFFSYLTVIWCFLVLNQIKVTCLWGRWYNCKAYQLVTRQYEAIRMLLGLMAQ